MMNVYKYIRSKDIREYNEKINHKFNATESAFIVWNNYDIPLKVKHAAWREIMSEMPDEVIAARPNAAYVPSLFALLNQFIETDDALIDEFYKKDADAVYSFRYYSKGDPSRSDDYGCIYSDFEYMRCEVKKKFDDDFLCVECVEYTKKYLSSPYRKISFAVDKDGNAMRVDGDFIFADNEAVNKDEFFEGLWVDVPTPFRRGDIVCSHKMPFGYDPFSAPQPFVVYSLANWSGEAAEERGEKLSVKEKAGIDKLLKYHRLHGDITDMTARGCFLNTDKFDRFTGDFYYEVMHDYTDLEYYRGNFNGGERVLLPLKYFLLGDIDEETLVKACGVIKKQEEVNREIKSLNLLDEWVEKIGLKINDKNDK